METATYEAKKTEHTMKKSTFWLIFPLGNQTQTLADALHALYYLPDTFKLIVQGRRTAQTQQQLAKYGMLSDRIVFESEAGSPETSPFSFSHLVISDDPAYPREGQPLIVVTDTAASDIESTQGDIYTVPAGHPAALATAVHKIARFVS
jgi:hypothetical protein